MFKRGDKIVYPHHGAGVVEKVEAKKVSRMEELYYVLRFPQGLKVMVPADTEEEMGLREVIGEEVAEEVLAYLAGRKGRMPRDWNRRFKKNKEKIKSGNIFEVAEVVKNLSIRDNEVGLSSAEKRMLMRAKEILLSELMFVLGRSEEELTSQLDKIFQ